MLARVDHDLDIKTKKSTKIHFSRTYNKLFLWTRVVLHIGNTIGVVLNVIANGLCDFKQSIRDNITCWNDQSSVFSIKIEKGDEIRSPKTAVLMKWSSIIF